MDVIRRFTGYRPLRYFRTTDVTGTLLPEVEMVMPGDNITMEVADQPIAMDEDFATIREGGRTSLGVIVKVIVRTGWKLMRRNYSMYGMQEAQLHPPAPKKNTEKLETKEVLCVLPDAHVA